jgi:hypothetical protein
VIDVPSIIVVEDRLAIMSAYRDKAVPSSLTGHESIRWYIDNPQSVKIVVTRSQYQPHPRTARALVWTTITGQRVLDTIYSDRRWDAEADIRQWARTEGILLSEELGRFNPPYLEVRMHWPTQDPAIWPFLDYFRFGRIEADTGDIILHNVIRDDTTMQFAMHDGSYVSINPICTIEHKGKKYEIVRSA